MNFRRPVFACLGLLLLLSGLTACPLSAAPAATLLARVHWLGLDQISADTNAAHFLGVWRLPQTTALVAQTLDKLSRRPGGGATNAASAALRPLLDDLVSSESCLELYAPPNSQLPTPNSQFLLALRLPADRARLWQNNLPVALPSATLSKSGDWTIVSLGADTAGRLPDFAARLAHNVASSTHFWLETDLDPARCFSLSAGGAATATMAGEVESPSLSSILHPPSALAGCHLHLTATGAAGQVLTHATLDLGRPLALTLPAWEIPTEFIHQPLTAFTAVRGLGPWLAWLSAWKELQFTNTPDQFFCWAQVQAGGPFVTYFAAPLTAADSNVSQLAARLVKQGNPWLTVNGQGHFEWQANVSTLVWHDALIVDPFLKPVTVNHHDWLLSGLIPYYPGNPNPPPADIVHAVLGSTNLVYYQAEDTGSRIDDNFFILQLFRVVFHLPQLPPKATATMWLKRIEPLLGDSSTSVIQTGPGQLALTRQSTLGFTALELHLLADWLESPEFPQGLHTFRAPPDK